MSATGELRVELAWDGAAVRGASCALGRPEAARVVIGQRPEEAIDRIRRLHAVCGHAQAMAARSALGAAADGASGPTTGAAWPEGWQDGLMIEALQEHLWRLLRDWPRALGEPVLDGPFARWYRALAGALKADGAARCALGEELCAWLDGEEAGGVPAEGGDEGAIRAWAVAGRGLFARLLGRAFAEPSSDEDGVSFLAPAEGAPAALRALGAPLATLRGEAAAIFGTQPHHHGIASETGPLSRHRAHPLVAPLVAMQQSTLPARLMARLCDLRAAALRLAGREPAGAEAPSEPLVERWSPAPGVGLSHVDTARGSLLHRAILDGAGDGARVAEYVIVAPTAWNFHPRGACARVLAGLRAPDEQALRRRAAVWMTAFDPCVPFRLEVRRA